MGIEHTRTAQLLSRWHAGDGKSLDELVERHLPWLHGQVRLRLGPLLRSKAETCDYVQDAMMQFLRYGPRFTLSDENHFRALLFRIVENTLRNKHDWFTARRREIARERPLPSSTIISLDPPEGSVRTPSEFADRNEREAWVRLAMEFLEPDDSEVIVFRQWDGLSFAEIGERLDLAANTARMRHTRALRKLTKKVAELRELRLEAVLGKIPS